MNHVHLSFNFSDNDIFDTYCVVSKCVNEHFDEWVEKKESMLNKWRIIYEDFIKANGDLKIIRVLVEFIFTLPGTN